MPFTITVQPKNKNAAKKEPAAKTEIKKREKLTSETVGDINFFKEDLEALDNEVTESDKIYDEVHKLWSNLTSGEYLPRNIKDVAELAKTMVSARTYKAQALNNRIALKKTIVDIDRRANGADDLDSNEAATATARQIINLIRQEMPSQAAAAPTPKADKRTAEGKKRAQEEEMLAKTIEERLNSGEIKMGKNDKLVGTNEHVAVRYDAQSESFVGVDSRTGKIIEDFPAERLPDPKELSRVSGNSAVMSDGNEVKLFDSLEFDDGYVDDAP